MPANARKIFFSVIILTSIPAAAETILTALRGGLRTTSCECLIHPSVTPKLRSCQTPMAGVRLHRVGSAGGTWAAPLPFGTIATDLNRPIWFYSETKESSQLTVETISSARATNDVLLNRREVVERTPAGFITKSTQHLEMKNAGDLGYELVFEKATVREKDGRSSTITTEKVVCKLKAN